MNVLLQVVDHVLDMGTLWTLVFGLCCVSHGSSFGFGSGRLVTGEIAGNLLTTVHWDEVELLLVRDPPLAQIVGAFLVVLLAQVHDLSVLEGVFGWGSTSNYCLLRRRLAVCVCVISINIASCGQCNSYIEGCVIAVVALNFNCFRCCSIIIS